MEKKFLDKKIYYSLVFINIVVCVLIIIRNVFVLNQLHLFLWFCDFIPFVSLFAILRRDRDLINGVINVGLTIQVIYFIVNIFQHFSGGSAISISLSLPNLNIWNLGVNADPLVDIFNQNLFLSSLSIIIHIFVIGLVFVFYKEKSSEKSLLYSFYIALFMYFSAFFLPWETNLNQVFSLFGVEKFVPMYTQAFLFWIFIVVVMPTYLIRNRISEILKE